MATTYLSRTPSSAGNRTKWTWSAWVKRHELGNYHYLLNAYTDNNNRTSILTWDGDWFAVDDRSSGTSNNYLLTNRVLRDTNGWYHFVVTVDTSLSTADDRVKIYINGVQETSFQSRTNPPQNHTTHANNNILHVIGKDAGTGYAEVTMSHIHFIDGTAYDASAFGEYDANGVWTIKTSPSVTYGTNGFFILKDGNSVTDQSGEGNNFTVGGGTLTNTEDNPSNVFCTMNPLASGVAIGGVAGTFANGNTFFSGASSAWCATKGTFSVTQGKWYMEAKKTTNANGTGNGAGAVAVGFAELQSNLPNDNPQNGSSIYGSILAIIDNGWTTNFANGTQWSTPQAVDDGDIVGIALDLDTNNYTFYVNGTQVDTGSLGAGYDGNGLTPCLINYGGDTREFYCNFGNGYFGTTAVASAGTNASGIGIFEHDVPTGYTALSTKGLNL